MAANKNVIVSKISLITAKIWYSVDSVSDLPSFFTVSWECVPAVQSSYFLYFAHPPLGNCNFGQGCLLGGPSGRRCGPRACFCHHRLPSGPLYSPVVHLLKHTYWYLFISIFSPVYVCVFINQHVFNNDGLHSLTQE